ncbi:hypothetical protein [Streptomyces neyagawaensis]|uniref:Uncharacterized protein n=1 Tax=Streptomyces neyagawaensis TaxID=42238 RepID=A0ABV3B0L7_9ACTN
MVALWRRFPIELLPHTDEERRYEEEGRALVAACERAHPFVVENREWLTEWRADAAT